MRVIAAMFLLTLRALARSRFIGVAAGLVLAVTVLLPAVLRDDGTVEGRARVWMRYTLGAAVFLLSAGTLGAAPGLVAGERESRRLQQAMVKPVRFYQVWLGKWLALTAVNGVVLLAATAAAFGLMRANLRAGRLVPEAAAALRDQVWTVRRAVRPATASRIVRPGETGEWRFRLARAEAGRPAPLMRMRFFSSASMHKWTVDGEWSAGPADGEPLFRERLSLRAGPPQTVVLPPAEEAGLWRIAFLNEDGDGATAVFDLRDGMMVWTPAGGYAANLARGVLLAWFRLALLAAAGVTMGTLFSTPVAAFMSYFVLALFLFSGHIGWVVETGRLVEPHHHHGDEPCREAHGFVQDVLEPVLKTVYRALNRVLAPIRAADAVERVSESERIEWREVGRGFGVMIPVGCGILAAAAALAAARREWG